MRVYASLPYITVLKGGGERTKEIYVISFAADLNPRIGGRDPIVGASNEVVAHLTPPGSEFFAVSVSNLFEGVKDRIPLSLSGDGVIVYPPRDPKGMLGLHIAVVESDKKTREIGVVLEEVFGHESVKSAMGDVFKYTSKLISSTVPQVVVANALGAVASVLPGILRKNKDDILMCHSHSGVDFNNYGGAHDQGMDFSIGNDCVKAVLRVWGKE